MRRDDRADEVSARLRRCWLAAVLVAASATVALGIGGAPRYLEELRIGGGYGDTVDGGADLEADGDVLTDGTLSVSGAVTGAADGSLTVEADTDVFIRVDADDDGSESLEIKAGDGTTVAAVDEIGNLDIDGDLTVSGNDIKSSSGSTVATLSGDDVSFADDATVAGLLSVGDATWLKLKTIGNGRERRFAGYKHYSTTAWRKVVEIDASNATAYCHAHLHITVRQRLGQANRGGFAEAFFTFGFQGTPTAFAPVWCQTRYVGSASHLELALKETVSGAKWEVWCYADSITHILAHAEYYSSDYSAININWDVFGDEVGSGTDVSANADMFIPVSLAIDSDDGMVKFGDDQDFRLRYELAGSDHYWKVEDGSGNDMLTVLDKGTVGEVGVTGTLDVDGRIEYANSGVVTLDGANPTPVDFTDAGGVDMPDATYAVMLVPEGTTSPITCTWANRATTGFDIYAWNVSDGTASTSSSLKVSWMVIDQ